MNLNESGLIVIGHLKFSFALLGRSVFEMDSLSDFALLQCPYNQGESRGGRSAGKKIQIPLHR